MTDHKLSDLLEDAGSRIPVGPAPVPVILGEVARRRRRRTIRWVAALSVTAAVAVIVGVALAGPADDTRVAPAPLATPGATTPQEWARQLPEGAPPEFPFTLGTTLYDGPDQVPFPPGSTGGGVVGRVQGGWLILVEQDLTNPYRFRSWFGVLTPSGDFTRLPEPTSGPFVQEAAVNPDGSLVATGVVVDVATNDVVAEVPNLPGHMLTLGWSPLGITYETWNEQDTSRTWLWKPGQDPVRTDIEISQVVPDSTRALTSSLSDACTDVVDVQPSGATERVWRGCGDNSPAVLSPDGQHVITRDGGILDISTGSVDRIDGVGPDLLYGIGWEDNEHILFDVHFDVHSRRNWDRVIVRCSITTLTCERAGNELRVPPKESLEFTGPGEH